MHNKSLTADGAVSILGGRNIGDIYFGLGAGVQFIDADVMVAGPAAVDIGTDFDRYWHSRSAHPIADIVGHGEPGALDRIAAAARQALATAEGRRSEAQRLNSSP